MATRRWMYQVSITNHRDPQSKDYGQQIKSHVFAENADLAKEAAMAAHELSGGRGGLSFKVRRRWEVDADNKMIEP